MDVGNVMSSSSLASTVGATSQSSQPERAERAQQANQDNAVKEQNESAKRTAEVAAQQNEQRPKPVVNAQGQTIGSVINETA